MRYLLHVYTEHIWLLVMNDMLHSIKHVALQWHHGRDSVSNQPHDCWQVSCLLHRWFRRRSMYQGPMSYSFLLMCIRTELLFPWCMSVTGFFFSIQKIYHIHQMTDRLQSVTMVPLTAECRNLSSKNALVRLNKTFIPGHSSTALENHSATNFIHVVTNVPAWGIAP